MSDAIRRPLRTLIQMIASGGLTILVNQLAEDVPTSYTPYILIGFTILVGFCQNWLEDNKGLPAIFKATASDGQNPAGNDPIK